MFVAPLVESAPAAIAPTGIDDDDEDMDVKGATTDTVDFTAATATTTMTEMDYLNGSTDDFLGTVII